MIEIGLKIFKMLVKIVLERLCDFLERLLPRKEQNYALLPKLIVILGRLRDFCKVTHAESVDEIIYTS
jgi:hypothetical protein